MPLQIDNAPIERSPTVCVHGITLSHQPDERTMTLRGAGLYSEDVPAEVLLRVPLLSDAANAAPRWFAGAAFGVLTAVLAGAVRAILDPVLGGQAPFLMHIPAVVVATWLGGRAGEWLPRSPAR